MNKQGSYKDYKGIEHKFGKWLSEEERKEIISCLPPYWWKIPMVGSEYSEELYKQALDQEPNLPLQVSAAWYKFKQLVAYDTKFPNQAHTPL